MIKELRSWGKSLIISFNEEEKRIHDLKPGRMVDLRDMVVLKEKTLSHALEQQKKVSKK